MKDTGSGCDRAMAIAFNNEHEVEHDFNLPYLRLEFSIKYLFYLDCEEC